MSDTGAKPEVNVSIDGIDVTKSYNTDEFPVPAVTFDIRSERTDEATVRLVDSVPEDVPPEDLGFHPEYGSEHWAIEDDAAVFERRLAPDEQFQTVYGIRTTDHDVEQFMTEPALDVEDLGSGDTGETETEDAVQSATSQSEPVEDGADATDVPGRDSSQAARDVISGENTVSGLDDEDERVEDVDVSAAGTADSESAVETGETSEATAETDTGARADSGGSGGDSVTEAAATGTTVGAGGVGAALASELRAGDLSDADRDLLTTEFTDEDAGSDVRISHLQSRISDLEAYTDALEEFIDENGPARKLIEDLTGQLESIEDELDALDERTSENAAAIDGLDDRTTENEGTIERLDEHTTENERAIDDLDERVSENTTTVEAVDKGVADVRADLTETQESVEGLRDDVAAIEDWRARISSVLGGVSETTDEE